MVARVHVIDRPPPTLPMPAGYVLPLLESHRVSPTSMTFRFSTRGTDFRYLSNQAVRLSLPGVDDPWGAVRTFSLSSSPSEAGEIAVTCKISDTPFKQALSRLPAGATAQVYGPLGSFLFEGARPCVFIAGGIGITPFRGMLRFAADTQVRVPLTLLYSARVPEELVFREELDRLARSHSNIHVHYTVTRPGESTSPWAGRVGRIDRAWIEETRGGAAPPLYYVAGLPEMVEQTVTTLTGAFGVPSDDIDYELFRGF
ncbi:MAG: FAD-dependent oxidoreductase [Thermoplasmata archaeon]